jgi:hypothetical protein
MDISPEILKEKVDEKRQELLRKFPQGTTEVNQVRMGRPSRLLTLSIGLGLRVRVKG